MKAEAPIVIHTDGACLGNPGRGGFGVVLISGRHRREIAGGYRRTTNNRMELMAAIVGLEAIKQSSSVKLISDSEYLVNAITKGWLDSWRRRSWKRSNKEKVLNVDLWKRLLLLLEKHDVTLSWVKGHAGNRENERCDELARAAADEPDLPSDPGYEEAEASGTTPIDFNNN